jgi:mono/diheme cytochrome c family protein
MKRTICAWLIIIAAGAVFGQFGSRAEAQVPAPPVPVRPPDLTPTGLAVSAPVAVPAPQTPPGQLPANILAFDAETQEFTATNNDPAATFTFNLTNVSSAELTINSVATSCGCTVARLPVMPWKLAAGDTGQIPVTMNLAGKSGVVFKTITMNTDKGVKMLMVKATITPPPAAAMTDADRARNLELAKVDRQAVFKGDCARCHVQPAIGKMGKELYVAACGVCHEGEHRNAMVPDLHALKIETNGDYWKLMVTHGKPGTAMPAFAISEGGPLSDPQIASLVAYLVQVIPSKPATQAGAAAAKGL